MGTKYDYYEAPEDAHLDLLLTLAFMEADALDALQIASECDDELSGEDRLLADVIYEKGLEALRRAQRKSDSALRMRRMWRWIPKIVQAAACIVLLIGIAAPIAIANVEYIRAIVMELLIDMQDEYTAVRLEWKGESELGVPAGWEGSYFPSYIPEGFYVEAVNAVMGSIDYANDTGLKIQFIELAENPGMYIDTENADATYIIINGYRALVTKKDERISVAWSDAQRVFFVSGTLPQEEIERIAQGIQKIE